MILLFALAGSSWSELDAKQVWQCGVTADGFRYCTGPGTWQQSSVSVTYWYCDREGTDVCATAYESEHLTSAQFGRVYAAWVAAGSRRLGVAESDWERVSETQMAASGADEHGALLVTDHLSGSALTAHFATDQFVELATGPVWRPSLSAGFVELELLLDWECSVTRGGLIKCKTDSYWDDRLVEETRYFCDWSGDDICAVHYNMTVPAGDSKELEKRWAARGKRSVDGSGSWTREEDGSARILGPSREASVWVKPGDHGDAVHVLMGERGFMDSTGSGPYLSVVESGRSGWSCAADPVVQLAPALEFYLAGNRYVARSVLIVAAAAASSGANSALGEGSPGQDPYSEVRAEAHRRLSVALSGREATARFIRGTDDFSCYVQTMEIADDPEAFSVLVRDYKARYRPR